MKQLLNPYSNNSLTDFMLLTARLVIGFLLLQHGFPKLIKLFSNEPVQFASVMGLSETTSLALAMFAELICAFLVAIGLFSRLASIPIVITMLVIVFHIHINDELSKKELPLLYLVFYSYILLRGAGKFSLDALLYKK
jgi:putative oxidoreductase